jgi:polyisoprenoid-binding protein YceI
MKKAFVRVVFTALLLLAPAAVSASNWDINPDHSSIQFRVRYMTVVNVKGAFDKFQGTANFDDKNIAQSSVNVTIDTASINTGNGKRDTHLRTDDFFDVAKYPTITFVSKKVVPADKGKLKITGDLTLLGVTKEVVLDVEGPCEAIKDPWGNVRRGASAKTTINRKDYGLTWNKTLDTGGVMIGDEVNVILEVELVKAPDNKAS